MKDNAKDGMTKDRAINDNVNDIIIKDEFLAYLFVPATRLDRVAKAFDSGADAVIIDLEDAVESASKPVVRQALKDFDAKTDRHYWLRINAAHTADYAHDVALIESLDHVAGVLLPKSESALSVTALHQATKLPVVAVVETARGVLGIGEIASAKGLFAMTYGCLDLSKALGITLGTPSAQAVLDKIRVDLLLHSSANDLHAPIETIFADFKDVQGVANFAKCAQDFGFGGQLLIHPSQVAPIKDATQPSDEMLEFARRVLQEYEQTGRAVFSVQGKMVDLPVIDWAKKLLNH
ncbi:CoA ester lyase [Moraxella nasibovis]|uniref:HpcH/HpaI aldolase/citrate lyase family protein n=1 Tax=Moraxella nasibovis TaxID=2904120 RepID=UPI00240F8122|nr:CoA ester lyase [Moraxella nasibovis]WFF38130.1 CoA ester lyase [Moraxella nasibovis]